MNTSKLQSIFLAAVLVFGAATTALVVPQTAHGAVSITASADTFYGPGFIRVLVTDTALDESGDTITPTVEARDGNTVLGSDSPTIEAIGGSGTFEFFITTSDAPLAPANPTKTTNVDAGFGDGPFIIRANTVSVDDLDEGAGTNVNGLPSSAASSVGYALSVNPANVDNFRVLYGGQTLVIDFDDSTAELTADRTEAGTGNEIVLTIVDQDANLDPTLIDEFEDDDLITELFSTNTLDLAGGDPTWRETGQNTGMFELVVPITVNTGTNDVVATLPTGNTFTATDHSIYEVVAGAVAPFAAITEEDDTDSISVTLRNRDGAIALVEDPTITNGLQVRITDADRNISTSDDDPIAETGEVDLLADATLAASLADAGITGVIVGIDLDGDGIIEPASGEAEFFTFAETGDSTGIFVPDYNDDKITIAIGAASDINGATGVITLDIDDIDSDIVVVYKDPAVQSNSVFQIQTEVETVQGELSAESEDVGITDDAVITLADADLNTDPDTIQTYSVGGTFEFAIGGEVVGELTVEAAGEELDPGDIDATFIETGPNTGIFVADDIDLTDIDGIVGLDDGDEIEFTYEDLIEEDDSDVTITVGIPDSGIDVDRSTIPMPQDGDPVTIVLSVIDPNANTNRGSVETVVIDFDDLVVRDGDGDTFDDGDADVGDLTGIAGDITLRETGPNTGIFEEDIELEPDAGIDIDRLRNTRVTFEYDGETVSVTYRSFDGTITVSPSVVSPGGEFEVTVTDQDLNKDPDERETVEVEFETDEDTDDGVIELEETGPNTGIFRESVEVGVDIVVSDVGEGDFSSEITLTYVDAVTSAGDEDEDRETTVRIATATGQLIVEPEVVGPGTEITLILIDTDLNQNPNSVDDVDEADEVVEISSSDGDDGFIGFEETGPNTGIFEATIQFEPRDPGDDGELDGAGDEWTYTALPGDIIAFRYEDESNASGNSVVIALTFGIISQDPEMDAASPTVQIGGTIALTIEDADANRDADSLDSVDVEITSDTDPVGFTLSALETGENTGIFTVNVPTSASVTSGAITVRSGDDVFLEYEDEFPADYADRVESVLNPSKDFVLVVPVGTSVTSDTGATTPSPVMPRDISGDELDEVSVGQQIVLSTTVNNNRNVDMDYAAIIEVRDSDGFTVLLQWATGNLPANDEVGVGLSWTPMEAGTYTVRTFVLSDISNPSALSTIVTSTLTVS
ncbi:hypothetical protein [Candidatus Nitrososphaera sp. FF02]|uniref:hypothetical protein n=1 Tax=Candidatus Nitrososphaera sp. FF02 TaxID=3398226 RepID=UPI0039E98E55